MFWEGVTFIAGEIKIGLSLFWRLLWECDFMYLTSIYLCIILLPNRIDVAVVASLVLFDYQRWWYMMTFGTTDYLAGAVYYTTQAVFSSRRKPNWIKQCAWMVYLGAVYLGFGFVSDRNMVIYWILWWSSFDILHPYIWNFILRKKCQT
jgi:hypothetical protein